METAKIVYDSGKITKAYHSYSGVQIITDAPLDNNGTASSFSPADLLSTSLVSCMLTIMAIKSEKEGFSLGAIESEMYKVMGSNPRRVTGIKVVMRFTRKFTPEQQEILKDAALNCPVAKSLHPDIQQEVEFHFV